MIAERARHFMKHEIVIQINGVILQEVPLRSAPQTSRHRPHKINMYSRRPIGKRLAIEDNYVAKQPAFDLKSDIWHIQALWLFGMQSNAHLDNLFRRILQSQST